MSHLCNDGCDGGCQHCMRVIRVRGPTGPTGPMGMTGADGSACNTGPTGSDGDRGESGPTGTTGSPGRPGSPGPAGTTGSTGTTGPTGNDGPTGPAASALANTICKIANPLQFTLNHSPGPDPPPTDAKCQFGENIRPATVYESICNHGSGFYIHLIMNATLTNMFPNPTGLASGEKCNGIIIVDMTSYLNTNVLGAINGTSIAGNAGMIVENMALSSSFTTAVLHQSTNLNVYVRYSVENTSSMTWTDLNIPFNLDVMFTTTLGP